MPSSPGSHMRPSFVGVNWEASGLGCRADPTCSPPFYKTADLRAEHEAAAHPDFVFVPAVPWTTWGNKTQTNVVRVRRRRKADME